MTTLKISKITIIQSLPESECQTGRHLYEHLTLVNSIEFDNQLKFELVNVSSKQELSSSLSRIMEEASMGEYPLIHLECHGLECRSGITLSDNTNVEWKEIYPHFCKINKHSELNLILVSSLCYGASFIEHISPSEVAPFLLAIGPTDKVSVKELQEAFHKFYNGIFSSTNSTKSALDLINKDIDQGYFFIATATYMFELMFKGLLNEVKNQDAIQYTKELTQKEIPANLDEDIVKYKFCETVFNRYYEIFFMINLYPEHKQRFCLSFKKIYKKFVIDTLRN